MEILKKFISFGENLIMKKQIIFTALTFLISTQIFGQNIFSNLKKDFFSGDRDHFFIRIDLINLEDDSELKYNNRGDEIRQNISIGYYIRKSILVGVSTINSYVDIREEGTEPIPNGEIVYGKQIFMEYNIFSESEDPLLRNAYLSLSRPWGKIEGHDYTEQDLFRIGLGLRYQVFLGIKASASYNMLFNGNINEGSRKGILNLGVAYSL